MQIKILIADSNYLSLQADFLAPISEDSTFAVSAEVRSGKELKDNLKLGVPDIVVIDFSSDGFNPRDGSVFK